MQKREEDEDEGANAKFYNIGKDCAATLQAKAEAAERRRVQKCEEDEEEEHRLRLAQLPKKQKGEADPLI